MSAHRESGDSAFTRFMVVVWLALIAGLLLLVDTAAVHAAWRLIEWAWSMS
jgi:hypothetical protein